MVQIAREKYKYLSKITLNCLEWYKLCELASLPPSDCLIYVMIHVDDGKKNEGLKEQIEKAVMTVKIA